MKNKTLKIGLVTFIVGSLISLAAYAWVFHLPGLQISSGEYWLIVKEPINPSSLTSHATLTITHPLNWQIACRLKRFSTIKTGRYKLVSGMSCTQIIHELRSGGKATVMVRIDDAESLEELSAKLGAHLMNDSAYFMSAFEDDSLLQSIGIRQDELAGTIRPNTYEFYWNMNAKTFLTKMKTESDLVWNSQRLEKANEVGLRPFEVVVLASIVKAETGSLDEAPKIAGLYLNRLRIQMPLQSDPTTLFGRKKSAQRVYLSDLQAESPYNTYLHKGLPPGPINFPEITYIDGVLNAEKHDYLYMCAQPDGSGKHAFAQTLNAHEVNRRNYIQWLEKKGIH